MQKSGLSDESLPDWWQWPLEFTAHLFKRMLDRGFSETDLRVMLEGAMSYRPDVEPGRWVIEANHDGRAWEVVVEPDELSALLVVVTAYPLG